MNDIPTRDEVLEKLRAVLGYTVELEQAWVSDGLGGERLQGDEEFLAAHAYEAMKLLSAGGYLRSAIAYLESPTRPAGCLNPLRSAEEAIEVLLQMRGDVGIPSWAAHIDLVVAYLETDPADSWRVLAARMWAAVSAAWNAAASATHDCSLRSDVLALTKDSALLLWDDPRADMVAEAERWLAEQVKTRAEALAEDYAARMAVAANAKEE